MKMTISHDTTPLMCVDNIILNKHLQMEMFQLLLVVKLSWIVSALQQKRSSLKRLHYRKRGRVAYPGIRRPLKLQQQSKLC